MCIGAVTFSAKLHVCYQQASCAPGGQQKATKVLTCNFLLEKIRGYIHDMTVTFMNKVVVDIVAEVL